jgi:hypothetical protein
VRDARPPVREVSALAAGAVARSPLARAALTAAVDSLVAPPRPRAALAALVALEREPARLLGDGRRARALVDAVAAELLAGAVLAPDAGRGQEAGEESEKTRPADVRPRPGRTDDAPAAEAGPRERPAAAEPAAGSGPPDPATRPSADPAAGEVTGSPASSPPDPESDPGAGPGAALTRTRGRTDAAGLLFLLHLVDELGLPEKLTVAEPLALRPFRWTLHALGLALAPLEPDDPAALAFAGLGPDSEAPSAGEEPPTEAETAVLAGHAARVAERLRELLERLEEPADEVLASVRARRGEIVSDPGWLEVHLALEDVDLDLRRAGLDVDPGWIPWLGAVVRFVYE